MKSFYLAQNVVVFTGFICAFLSHLGVKAWLKDQMLIYSVSEKDICPLISTPALKPHIRHS